MLPHHGCQPLCYAADALGVGLFGLIAPVHRLREAALAAVEDGVGVGVVGIVHLVAYAPHEDAGMASVAPYHIGYIAVYPFLEVVVCTLESRRAIVPPAEPFALGKFPFVAGFVHH